LMLIQSLSFVLGAVLSLLIVKMHLNVRFTKINYTIIKLNLKEGWSLFLSTVGMNLYRESNVIILGLVSGYSIVGIYSPAEKLVKGIQSFSNIIVTVVYPYFSKQSSNKTIEFNNQFQKFGKILALFLSLFTVFLFFLSSVIMDLYIGEALINDNTS